MAEVVGVHGIAQQQAGRHQLLDPWRRACLDGLERAKFSGPEPSVDIAYYGHLFLSDDGGKGPGDVSGLDDDAIDFLAEIGEELASGEPDPAPKSEVAKGFKSMPKPLRKLASMLDSRFGVVGRLLFFGDLVQVRRYQRDARLAEEVREIVAATLVDKSCVVLAGHSLGSVVAYETLCVAPDAGVDTLVTMGSPLGLHSVQRGLIPDAQGRGLPSDLKRWVNIYDAKDPVALAGDLRPFWRDVDDRTVDNGNSPHDVARYLGKRSTGEALLDALVSGRGG